MIRCMIALFFLFCLIGAGLEWCYGMLWNAVGTAPWIYPDSPLSFTAIEVIPLWGFGGLICALVYRAFSARKAKELRGAVIPVILALLWVLVYGWLG